MEITKLSDLFYTRKEKQVTDKIVRWGKPSSASKSIQIVDNLPTENIDKNCIYSVGGQLYRYNGKWSVLLELDENKLEYVDNGSVVTLVKDNNLYFEPYGLLDYYDEFVLNAMCGAITYYEDQVSWFGEYEFKFIDDENNVSVDVGFDTTYDHNGENPQGFMFVDIWYADTENEDEFIYLTESAKSNIQDSDPDWYAALDPSASGWLKFNVDTNSYISSPTPNIGQYMKIHSIDSGMIEKYGTDAINSLYWLYAVPKMFYTTLLDADGNLKQTYTEEDRLSIIEYNNIHSRFFGQDEAYLDPFIYINVPITDYRLNGISTNILNIPTCALGLENGGNYYELFYVFDNDIDMFKEAMSEIGIDGALNAGSGWYIMAEAESFTLSKVDNVSEYTPFTEDIVNELIRNYDMLFACDTYVGKTYFSLTKPAVSTNTDSQHPSDTNTIPDITYASNNDVLTVVDNEIKEKLILNEDLVEITLNTELSPERVCEILDEVFPSLNTAMVEILNNGNDGYLRIILDEVE